MAGPHAKKDKPSLQRWENVYAHYGKALEATHWGQFLAVSPGGETVVGPNLVEVARQAAARFGPGVLLFKVGERVTARWHSPRLGVAAP